MSPKHNTAVIFAGGKSSRMGTDKALLPFGDYGSMTEYLYRKLEPLFENVYISSKVSKFDFNASIIADKYPQSSPMVALLSTFETLSCDEIFIISVDSPFISKQIIDSLYAKAKISSDADAIIALSPSGVEPMCGIYKRGIYTLAKEYLNSDIHQLMKLLHNSKVGYVEFTSNEEFSNLNSPDEYKIALTKF